MTWTPTARIVRSAAPPAFRNRGICPDDFFCWPDAALGGGADYSVDFSPSLGTDEVITDVSFGDCDGAIQSWTYISGSIVTAWITWYKPGRVVVPVCIQTNFSNTHQARVAICISPEPSLIISEPPPSPGQTLTAITSNGAYLACGGAVICAG